MIPKFVHDCERCTFLGHYEGHDLYYCPKEPTVIARWGNEGPEYTSGLPFANEPLSVVGVEEDSRHMLRVAWLLAKDMDVITKSGKKAEIWHPKE